MQYMGSKNRIAKELLPIILKDRKPDQWYVEPFVGGANMIDKVTGLRIGNDSHSYLISLLKALQHGWVPPVVIDKTSYYEIKSSPVNFSPELVGFVGFLCSFGGKWWGGYAANSKGDNYAERGSRCLVKQAKGLIGVDFYNLNYCDVEIPPNSIVYCDPPYEGTTKYKGGFDHLKFWNWVREISKSNQVFVSEYSAPEDFECVKEIAHKTILNKNSQDSRVEKLFKLKK